MREVQDTVEHLHGAEKDQRLEARNAKYSQRYAASVDCEDEQLVKDVIGSRPALELT